MFQLVLRNKFDQMQFVNRNSGPLFEYNCLCLQVNPIVVYLTFYTIINYIFV